MTHSETHAPQLLSVEGATCASCVSKIEGALNAVHGVEQAEMNLAQRTVSVIGSANESRLIRAIQEIGYDAHSTEGKSDETILDEQAVAEQGYYRKLIRETVIALLLGVPLMIYGLFIGEMTISNHQERLVWLMIGLLTFAVMVTSGRHFYLGGWNSIRSHNANMDTLIPRLIFPVSQR